jgi:predicted O-linked N-acetylglucosamine transferase (SPINDLY family)
MRTTSALLSQAIALHQAGKLASAESYYLQVLKANPRDPNANHLLGILRGQQGAPGESLKLIEKAVRLAPGVPMFVMNYALALKGVGRHRQALRALDEVLAKMPANAAAWTNRGLVQIDLGLAVESIASYDRALAIDPRIAAVWINRGNALRGLDRLVEAVESYDRALELAPNAEAHCERGKALVELRRLGEALDSFAKAIHHNPGYLEAYSNRAIALFLLNDAEAAVASCDEAIALKPDYAEAHNYRGNALLKLKRLEEALASYDRAISIKPDYAEAFYNRGIALFELKRLEGALASYDRAISIKPDYAEAFNSRGNLLVGLNRLEEAVASFDRAVSIKPDYFDAAVASMHWANQMCKWLAGTARADLIARCRVPAFDGSPFAFLAICDDPKLHHDLANAYVRNKAPLPASPLWRQRRARDKIRIGYLSADFREHPVSYLIAEVIALHDRSRFEVFGISTSANDGGEQRRRLEATFDAFVDVNAMTDTALARRIAEAEIDIVVDLGGHTGEGRILALADRPAPVQVTYLGYPGTTGAPFIDYAIIDAHVVPASDTDAYSEKLVYLPECYLCNDRNRKIADQTPSRVECGLPADGFVFCCFNNSYKINAPVFDIWMRLLRAVPGSVLWLRGDNNSARASLQREATARGVAPQRLVFAERVGSNSEHLARHRVADLFIDTLPYNAHTTASDALWVGLPVLTCTGRSFAARVAGSLLHAIGLPELVTGSLLEYEALALRLATYPAELRALRDRLVCNRSTHPLFDTPRWTRHLEAAYQEMWRLHCNGEPPRSFAANAYGFDNGETRQPAGG